MPRIKYDPVANALDAIAAKNPIKQLSKGLIQTPTGINVNTFEMWNFLPKAQEIRASRAQQILSVGGTRSGKSVNAIMIGVIDFCLRYPNCSILCLRRTFGELEAGLIKDFKDNVPKELYTFNESKKLAVFTHNGSRVQFGHMADGTPRSLHQYLGSAYSFILIDECGQFPWEAWELLRTRLSNSGVKPDTNGNYPTPQILGTTNPIGPYWGIYRQVFRDGKPAIMPEGAKKDKCNRYWVNDGPSEEPIWRCVHNPDDYLLVHSTLLDNPYILAKDPGIYARLNGMSDFQRQKFLFGDMDGISGQYFDNFDPFHHVINLRTNTDTEKPHIQWQEWQPKWIGWDWGRVHANVVCWFTKALVKGLDDVYRLKTVCYRELVTKGQVSRELADQVKKLSGDEKIAAIYFSHEKFAKQMETHSPADILSGLLRERGLPAVTPATRDRIGRATLCYNLLQEGQLVILDSCTEVVKALPQLIRNDKTPEDVLKVDSLADDVYDGFSYGVFGYLNNKPKPIEVKRAEHIESLKNNPFEQRLAIMRLQFEEQRRNELAAMPVWQRRLAEEGKL